MTTRPEPRPDRSGGSVAQRGAARGARAPGGPIEEAEAQDETHLLIAEDDTEMRQFLVESFEEDGYHVTEAKNGTQLRQQLLRSRRNGTPILDLVISDICLPGLSGLQLLSELRQKDWSLPVILITAFGDESVHHEGMRLGAAMVLDKPFDIEALKQVVWKLAPPNGWRNLSAKSRGS